MDKSFKIFLIAGILLSVSTLMNAQSNTVGLIFNDSTSSYNGYTLFSPLSSNNTYLIDNDGYVVHSWTSDYKPGQAVMLLPDGDLLRTASVQAGNSFTAGGSGGRVEKYDWDGKLIWYFDYYSQNYSTHHDVEYLPNGNILLISWEKKNYDEAVAAGRNPSKIPSDIWSEKIIEVKPTGSSGGDIVWEWHVWDHLIQDYDVSKLNYGNVAEHPELIDLNYGGNSEDWLHINSIRYNPDRDEIMVSVHNFGEIWIIDHSTTTEQAASHSGGTKGKGGDLLYRWGNPQVYRAGSSSDQNLFGQHDARWIDNGNPGNGDIMIFDNGMGRSDGKYSTIEEITTPFDSNGNYYLESTGMYGPDESTWGYEAQPASSFFAQNISGATRMPNGNTLICEGPNGKFFEVDNSGNIVWEYISPVTKDGVLNQGDVPNGNPVFKIYRYAPDYSGLSGKDLSRKGKIENTTTGIGDNDNSIPTNFSLEQNYPNPFNPSTTIKFTIPPIPSNSPLSQRGDKGGFTTLKIYDTLGREIKTLVNEQKSPGSYEVTFDASNLASGIYFYNLQAGTFFQTKKMLLIK